MTLITPEWKDYIKNFEVYESDWFVTSYPKSGTAWMHEIVYLIKNQDDLDRGKDIPNHIRVPFLDLETPQRKQYILQQTEHPRIFKTHMLCDELPSQIWEKSPKIIQVYRDPKDVAVSFFHHYSHPNSLEKFKGPWSEFFKMFITGDVAFGSWAVYMKKWFEHKDNSNILFVKYESLLEDLRGSVRKIAAFLRRPLPEDTLQKLVERVTFESMKNNPMTNSIFTTGDNAGILCQRKGIAGDWKNYFTVAQLEEFDQWYEMEMGNLNIEDLE